MLRTALQTGDKRKAGVTEPDAASVAKQEIVWLQASPGYSLDSIVRLAEIARTHPRLLSAAFSALAHAQMERGIADDLVLNIMADLIDRDVDAAIPATKNLPSSVRAGLLEEWGRRSKPNAAIALKVLATMRSHDASKAIEAIWDAWDFRR